MLLSIAYWMSHAKLAVVILYRVAPSWTESGSVNRNDAFFWNECWKFSWPFTHLVIAHLWIPSGNANFATWKVLTWIVSGQSFVETCTQSISRNILRSTAPFNPLGNYGSKCYHRQENKSEIRFYHHFVQVIEWWFAFWIDVLWLNKSPCESPGSLGVYCIMNCSVTIVFGDDLCGTASGREI